MPTNRRIIYIRNPKEGSHFRTIGGSGGGGTRPPRPKKPPPWKPGDPIPLTGGAWYGTPPANWFIRPKTPYTPHPSGDLPGYGIHPDNVLDFSPDFIPPETFWGDLYLIMMGVDPATGNMLAPYGTPGTLKPFPELSFGYGETWKEQAYRRAGKSPYFFGTLDESGFLRLPSGYTGRARNRKKPRPWWAK